MPDKDAGRDQAILNLDAYSPSEIQVAIEKVGVTKADMPFLPCFMLGVVAGGSIGFGALYYTIVASDAQLSFAVARVLGGLVFSLGLTLVLVCGAELFTGNNLIVMAWASRRVSLMRMLRNWVIVYSGNVVGAIGLVVLVVLSRHLEMNNGRLAQTVIDTASAKIRPDFLTLFFKGVLCNVLVCMAVWMAMAGRSVVDKAVAVVFPIAAFVAAGFEHSIANMYLLPLAMLVQDPAAAQPVTWAGLANNLVFVIAGNLLGGSVLVGLTYHVIYGRPTPEQPAGEPAGRT